MLIRIMSWFARPQLRDNSWETECCEIKVFHPSLIIKRILNIIIIDFNSAFWELDQKE